MTDICRLCASLKRLDHLQSLCNPALDASTKLARCCQLQFPPASDELLPQMVCLDCVGHLNSSFAFAERVQQAQETLRQAFLVDMQLEYNGGKRAAEQQQTNEVDEVQSSACDGDEAEEQMPDERCIGDEPQFKIRSVIHSLHLKGYSVTEICERLKLADTKMVSDWIFTYQTLTQCSQPLEVGRDRELQEAQQEQRVELVCKDEQHEDGAIEDMVVEDELRIGEGNELDVEEELAENMEEELIEYGESDLSLKSNIEIVEELNGFADSNESTAPNVFLPTCFDVPDASDYVQLVQRAAQSSPQPNAMASNDSDPFELVLQALHPDEKLPDGRISDIGCQRIGLPTWHKYPWNCATCVSLSTDPAASAAMASAAAVRRHARRHHPAERVQFACADCPAAFARSQQLVDHVRDQHEPMLRLSCDLCSAPFWLERALREHRETHLPQPVAVCVEEEEEEAAEEERTSVAVAGRDALNGDERLSEPSAPSRRGSNSSSCTNREQFDDDQLAPDEAEAAANVAVRLDLLCAQCGCAFATRAALQQHQRQQHSSDAGAGVGGGRPFVCDQCGIGFAVKRKLNAHLIEAHWRSAGSGDRRLGGRPTGGGGGGSLVVDAASMTVTAEKIYHCDECSKTFKTQVRLLKHRTVHTGQKPYKCDQCGREFRERGTLREHVRIHTGAMPFVCEFCNKRFRFKGVLTTHRRQHTGERPYSCIECNHHFTNWPNYNKHMKRKHGINTSVNVRKPQAIPPSGMPAKAKLNHVVPTAENVNPPASTPTPAAVAAAAAGAAAASRLRLSTPEMNESIELQLQPDTSSSSASASVCIEYLATSGGDANDLTTEHQHHQHHHRVSGDVSVVSSADATTHTTASASAAYVACGEMQPQQQQQQQHIAARPVLFGSYAPYMDQGIGGSGGGGLLLQPATSTTVVGDGGPMCANGFGTVGVLLLADQKPDVQQY